MTVAQAVHALTGLLYIASMVMAVLFYRDFFAASRPPREWLAVYAGLVLVGGAYIIRAVFPLLSIGGTMTGQIVGVTAVTGSLLLLIGTYRLWERFRL